MSQNKLKNLRKLEEEEEEEKEGGGLSISDKIINHHSFLNLLGLIQKLFFRGREGLGQPSKTSGFNFCFFKKPEQTQVSAGLLRRLYLEDLGWGWVLEHNNSSDADISVSHCKRRVKPRKIGEKTLSQMLLQSPY